MLLSFHFPPWSYPPTTGLCLSFSKFGDHLTMRLVRKNEENQNTRQASPLTGYRRRRPSAVVSRISRTLPSGYAYRSTKPACPVVRSIFSVQVAQLPYGRTMKQHWAFRGSSIRCPVRVFIRFVFINEKICRPFTLTWCFGDWSSRDLKNCPDSKNA